MRARPFKSRFATLLAALFPLFSLAILPARAGLTFTLQVTHEVDHGFPPFSETNYQILIYDIEQDGNLPAAPSGLYTISSPTAAVTESFQLSAAGISNYSGTGSAIFSNYTSFIQEITNGSWTISVSNGAVVPYTFQMSAPSFTSNTLPNVNVTYPTPGAVVSSNNPNFTWQTISWPGGDIQVEDYSGPFFQENYLLTSATNWTSPSNLPVGKNTFLVTYSTAPGSTVTATTPENGMSQPISSWTFQSFISTYAVDGFTVTNGPLTMAEALNTTNLTWTISGKPWFPETNYSHDGVAAAQSASISGTNQSVLQTTVTGPGTLTFWWSTMTPSDDFDFDLEFEYDNIDWDDIGNIQPWVQESTVSIGAGTHTLTWTAYSADYTNDAGWVDQVVFSPAQTSNGPASANVSLSIERLNDQTAGTNFFSAYPYIQDMEPAPVTTNELVSPDGFMYSDIAPGATNNGTEVSEYFPTLDQAIYACTNGQWSLIINKGLTNQQVFHFTVSINSLTTNLLGTVAILTPAPFAINVASNTPIQWTGPTNSSGVFVETYQLTPSFSFTGYTNLSTSATSWPSPPLLPTGTNEVFVQDDYYYFTNFNMTLPADSNSTPLVEWGTGFYLYSTAQDTFTVKNPLAVILANAAPSMTMNGNFGLSFQTIPGYNELVQERSNLVSGNWVTVTNIMGTGSNYNLSIPLTNTPNLYFRVITQ